MRSIKPSRVEIINTAINANESEFLIKLRDKGRIKVLDFAEKPVEVDVADKKTTDQQVNDEDENGELLSISLPDLIAKGVGTDISRAIDESIEESLTSSVIIFTDGQHNTSSD